MELKVWVDGIQRVVCGVTEASTCQDVVYALAHATGQTGRFTLLERWRGSERLLAPADRPLRVLAKWGEYAGDVHFLMRRSDAATSSSASSNANNHKSRFAPAKQAVKKSLTFSGGGGGGSGDEDRPKGVVRGRPRHPPPYDEAVSRSSGRFPTSQQQLSLPPPSDPLPKQQQPQEGQDSPKSPELKKLPLPAEEEKEGNEEVEVVAARDPQYQDLLRLVSLQREKLDNQQSELSQFDAEILYWENRLQEQEEKLSILQEEVCHLERTQHEQEGELIQLDRRSFSEEVDLGRQEERTLRSELTLARSQLANCETELLQCRQRIRLLLEEMAEERRLRTELERKEREEQERSLQAQLDCIQQQLKEKMVEADSQAVAEQAKEEMHDLELKLEDKEKEIGKLMADIREANLRSLSLMPSEEGKLVLEGNFHNRPGSTRKIIGSPRQLENAVPTNKNPHGVWV